MLRRAIRFTDDQGRSFEYVLSGGMRGGVATVRVESVGEHPEVFPALNFPTNMATHAVLLAIEQMKAWPQHKGMRCELDYRPLSRPDMGVMPD
ncbi:MAG: hypothetical protein AB7O26_01550 [Planctomycetaceae bacterium]